MKTKTQRALDAALEKQQKLLIKSLTVSAAKAYIDGAKLSFEKLGLSFTQVNQEALKFATEYGELLMKEGASMIQEAIPPYGYKKVAWLKDSTAKTRKELVDIIRDGLKEGKPVGTKHAYEGTIAYDLNQHLLREKTFENVRIARTEPARIQLEAGKRQFISNGILEIRRACGPNPCDICAPLCGRIYKINEAPGLLHPNGRCDNIPIIPEGGL